MIRLPSVGGEVRLTVLPAGSLWLDGGAMFGIVPKPLWSREREPDESNRIELALNLLLVEDGRQTMLVDTGIGTKWDDKSRGIYRIEGKTPEEILAPVGLRPDAIDVVVCTHLHFDHVGGNTVRDPRGELAPAFPDAEYVVQRGELEIARWDNERIRASYLPENFEPLVDRGQMRLVEGETPLSAQVSVLPAPGHTPHMQIVLVRDGETTTAFLADLVPTASHLRYPYIMGYDLEPLATLASKQRILPRAVREDWQVIFEHDGQTAVARLAEESGRVRLRPAEVGG